MPDYVRLLNKDGTFNILRPQNSGESNRWRDTYHWMLKLSWPRFIALIVAVDLLLNIAFALAYLACGPLALENVHGEPASRVLDAFFFSVQTLATIGYGKITPVTIPANLLVTFEAFIGMLFIALSTGLMFAKFARPTARVRFSKVAIIAPHDGVPSLVFRIANERANQIAEAKVNVAVSVMERTKEGEFYRTFYDLKLERSETPIFALSWTIVHPIESDSPLYPISPESLKAKEAEFIVTLTGVDDTFAQTIHARHSYLPSEIAWNHRFEDMIEVTPEGLRYTDLSKIHQTLPQESGRA